MIKVKCSCGNECTPITLGELIDWLRNHARECGETVKITGKVDLH